MMWVAATDITLHKGPHLPGDLESSFADGKKSPGGDGTA